MVVRFGDATRHRWILFWRDALSVPVLGFVPRLSPQVPHVRSVKAEPRNYVAAWAAANAIVAGHPAGGDSRRLSLVDTAEGARAYREWTAQLPEITPSQRELTVAAARAEGLIGTSPGVWLGILPLERELVYSIGHGAVLADRGVLNEFDRVRDVLRRAVRT